MDAGTAGEGVKLVTVIWSYYLILKMDSGLALAPRPSRNCCGFEVSVMARCEVSGVYCGCVFGFCCYFLGYLLASDV